MLCHNSTTIEAAMKALIFACICFLQIACTAASEAQELSKASADAFITDLLQNPAELEKWVQPEELALSKRLGIGYYDVLNKFLISYDVSEDIRNKIKNKTLQAEYQTQQLDPEYTRLALSFVPVAVPDEEAETDEPELEYYFQGERLISPIRYYTRNWNRLETDYFVFYLSDFSLFNRYSARKLDEFVTRTLDILDVPPELRTKLRQEKIYYFRCRDAEEIRILTGYASRGMYNLAYDYILSTFNCHYHEIVHMLVNYKLRSVHMHTHPFLQEGIAVALGGRGGKEPAVIMNLAMFLERSGFVSYEELLSYESFMQMDPSLSYPVSGLYSEFLLKELNINRLMELYEHYSGVNSQSDISLDMLPPDDRWSSFLRSYGGSQPIAVNAPDDAVCRSIVADSLAEICEGTRLIHFKIKGAVLIGKAGAEQYYQSTIFKELLPGVLYRSEKYLVVASTSEISVYNLYTDNLTAKYIPTMSVERIPIPTEDGYFKFCLEKSVFEEDLQDLSIRVVTSGGFRPQ